MHNSHYTIKQGRIFSYFINEKHQYIKVIISKLMVAFFN